MKSIYNIYVAFAMLILASCNSSPKLITNAKDYNDFLVSNKREMLHMAKSDLEFWEKKLEKEPNQFPYLAKIAASQTLIFNLTGNIEALINAEKNLLKVNERTNYNKAGYLRALARNYVSQHKFKEALSLLTKAETNGENLKGTQKMLFDVHLELGNFETAKTYLEHIRKNNDFDYLIRLSKWSDHRGDLTAAIKYMEQAKKIAEASNLASTKQWVYTNLADFYGHAGRVSEAYQHYIKALQLNPEDAYAKKGIAWIVYSYEQNPEEALRILNTITLSYNSPDYYLLKAEIASFIGDTAFKAEQLRRYDSIIINPLYGDMYNKYTVLLYAENDKKSAKALEIAYNEIEKRPTPQSYDLLAWTFYNHGDAKEAMQIMDKYVVGKTTEPEVLFHLAKIYNANGKLKEVKSLKDELLQSTFELGPIMTQEINSI
ncbi:tetratricopeptide repeat protein [Tamlana sp. 62-3]|uniref:Tetratricopeptide repeat protein n=1 Tax=Neotamlana sargassicola TaxID=2883125 RepID=A0A9X1L567_9FLAO|nr:tetratricopeptide repeat protein [Tamlana sargassicola]MCB4808865.1 tetratricopeptide repeat protein [Tamlana sargassicola]